MLTALEYIETHRAILEPEFTKAIQLRQAREAYYRKQNEEVWEKIAKAPMTPERAVLRADRKNHREAMENGHADRSQ